MKKVKIATKNKLSVGSKVVTGQQIALALLVASSFVLGLNFIMMALSFERQPIAIEDPIIEPRPQPLIVPKILEASTNHLFDDGIIDPEPFPNGLFPAIAVFYSNDLDWRGTLELDSNKYSINYTTSTYSTYPLSVKLMHGKLHDMTFPSMILTINDGYSIHELCLPETFVQIAEGGVPFPTYYYDTNGNPYTDSSLTQRVACNDIIAPVITSRLTASSIVGASFSYSIVAKNNPTSYNASGLPPGLTINTNSGVISGIPTVPGVYTITISAINSAGRDTATLSLYVESVCGQEGQSCAFTPCCPGTGLTCGSSNVCEVAPSLVPVITSPLAVTVKPVQQFSYTITATNNPTSFFANNLPPRFLSFNSTTGVISGNPLPGVYNIEIGAINSAGTDTEILVLEVEDLDLVIER